MPSRGRARYVLQVVPGRERAVAERVKALAGPELVRDCFALSYCILKK
ncbi:antitermination protein NusG, partial [Eggerthella lenta]